VQPVTAKEVFDCLCSLAPLSLAQNWDNPGLLVEADTPVTDILTALDITERTVQEAADKNCQLIVAHHPVIFKPLKSVQYNNVIYEMIVQKLSGICMHTNLDCAAGGTGDVLSELMQLSEVKPFAVGDAQQLGRVGVLPQPISCADLAVKISDALHGPVKFCGESSGTVQRLAVITGSAGECWREAQAAGADALLTGEISYHHALDAAAAGFVVFAAGHYATEAPIAGQLARQLHRAYPQLRVTVSETMQDVFSYLI